MSLQNFYISLCFLIILFLLAVLLILVILFKFKLKIYIKILIYIFSLISILIICNLIFTYNRWDIQIYKKNQINNFTYYEGVFREYKNILIKYNLNCNNKKHEYIFWWFKENNNSIVLYKVSDNWDSQEKVDDLLYWNYVVNRIKIKIFDEIWSLNIGTSKISFNSNNYICK